MATNTSNYGWTKPDYEDDADISVLNEIFDAIDEQVKTNENNISTDEAALVELVDGGAKNFINVGFTSKVATATSPSITNNSDGSITINGSNTRGEYVVINDLTSDLTNDLNTRYTLPIGEYVISPIDNVNVKVQVYMHDGTNRLWLGDSRESKNRFNYTTENKAQYPYIAFRINLLNATFDYYTIYPMICTKPAWDISQTYQPYRPSYQELYERIVALEQANQ